MADSNTVIVNIPKLEEAISQFRNVSSAIGACASDLQSNAGVLRSAWTANASDVYQQKIQVLKGNIDTAKEKLDVNVNDLSAKCEKSRTAEKTADNIVNSINSIKM